MPSKSDTHGRDVYLTLGGAWIGYRDTFWSPGFHATWPFCRLSLSEEAISLRILWRKYHLRHEEIVEIQRFRGFFSVGVKFIHSVPTVPKKLIFWPLAFETLEKRIGTIWSPNL